MSGGSIVARIMPGTDTYLGLRAFVDELVRCGLRFACTSPGSRSTPLVLTLARAPGVRATSHLDERCAGFFALGLAKASGVPAALACTSGTAAANYAPAVIEAFEARVPLLVLTADRPPELRDIGAGQTIDQVKLFGSAAKWYFEVDDHPASPARLRWLRQLACRAFWTAVSGRPGPVHLNFSFREPLVPDGDGVPDVEVAPGRDGGRPWVTRPRASTRHRALLDALARRAPARPRAVVVAGRSERDPSLGPALAAFCGARRRSRCSPIRCRARAAGRPRSRTTTRCCVGTGRSCPELVLRVGDLPTSKPLRTWLASLDALQVASTRRPPGRTRRARSARSSPPIPRAVFDALRRAAHGRANGSTRGTPQTAPPPPPSPQHSARPG